MSQISNSTQNVKIFTCDKCDYLCNHISNFNKHLSTQKHKKNEEEINTRPQCPYINIQKYSDYNCSHCNYFTKKMSEFNKHTNTQKHKNNINPMIENTIKYNCKYCKKEYNKKNSCTKHEKKCIIQNSINDTIITSSPKISNNNDIINRLIQENQELRNFMTEQNKEFMRTITDLTKNNNTINNNNQIINNNNNNKFNINVFLNEKCKDAMNFADFIKNIEVSHEDLENNAQLGFVNGISKIIVDNLKQLSIYDRPIHCSDVKRETMYITHLVI